MWTERPRRQSHLWMVVWLLLAAITVTSARDKFAFHRPTSQPGKQLIAFTMECNGKHEIATARTSLVLRSYSSVRRGNCEVSSR